MSSVTWGSGETSSLKSFDAAKVDMLVVGQMQLANTSKCIISERAGKGRRLPTKKATLDRVISPLTGKGRGAHYNLLSYRSMVTSAVAYRIENFCCKCW